MPLVVSMKARVKGGGAFRIESCSMRPAMQVGGRLACSADQSSKIGGGTVTLEWSSWCCVHM